MVKPPTMLKHFIYIAILAIMATGWLIYNKKIEQNAAIKSFGSGFVLTDNKGQTITEKDFSGHPSILFFGFTHFLEICPIRLAEVASWIQTLSKERKEIKAYFITIDPERDTPEILNNYLSNVSNNITGISGEPSKVYEMAKNFKVF